MAVYTITCGERQVGVSRKRAACSRSEEMTLLYISGPMTGYPEHNFPAFMEASRLLHNVGYDTLNPAEFGLVDGWSWSDYLRKDIGDVLRSDGIAVLPGADLSRGAALELHVARSLEVPCMPVAKWIEVACG